MVISILMDVIQLGLYFSAAQDTNGGGDSKMTVDYNDLYVTVFN